jgi:hypothetical protein
MEIEKILNIFILISLLVLFIFINLYKIDPCSSCKFEINNKTINIQDFWKLFEDKCLTINEFNIDNRINISNFSLEVSN